MKEVRTPYPPISTKKRTEPYFIYAFALYGLKQALEPTLAIPTPLLQLSFEYEIRDLI